MLKDMIALTKPGLLRLNVFAVAVGFWVASKWDISWISLLMVLIGSTLVIASACVINNYWDRELDQKMERTKNGLITSIILNPSLYWGMELFLVWLVLCCCTSWSIRYLVGWHCSDGLLIS